MLATESVMAPLLSILDGEDKSHILKNCIRKNYQHLRKWAKRTQTNCFRIYDRDIKAYPLAIDYYAQRLCVHYFASSYAMPEPSAECIAEINRVLIALFGCTAASIYWRLRIKRKKTEQYEKQDSMRDCFIGWEHGVQFQINLTDYLDTGLFLDHRQTRRLVAAQAKGKHLLNLFAYTCAFSVHAAQAGAIATTSVDLSNTYIEWGKINFALNQIALDQHAIIRQDCLQFLAHANPQQGRYDLIVIDPPTLSRSKKMTQLFDIQKDYLFLIQKALKLLANDGVIFFSTNSRQFIFDGTFFTAATITEITYKTIPIDFHQRKIHRCWQIKAN